MPQRSQERDFLEFTASSYEYCYANPVRFTDPNGEQPTNPIGYVGTQRATSTPAVNATPKQQQTPQFPWSNAMQGGELEKGKYYTHTTGGWLPANISPVFSSLDSQKMESQGYYTASGAAREDFKSELIRNDIGRQVTAQAWNEHVMNTNPGVMIAKATNEFIVTPGREIAQNVRKGNYAETGVGLAMFTPIGRIMKEGEALIKIVSLVKQDAKLLKYAEETFKGNQALRNEANALIEQMSRGNTNPGIGTKSIGDGIFEARSRGGARVYFKTTENEVQILGYSNKKNQQEVINQIKQNNR